MLEKKKEVGQPVNGVKTAVAKQKTRPQAPLTGKDAAASLAAAAPAPAQPSAGAAQPSSSSSSSGVHADGVAPYPSHALRMLTAEAGPPASVCVECGEGRHAW